MRTVSQKRGILFVAHGMLAAAAASDLRFCRPTKTPTIESVAYVICSVNKL